MRKLLLATSVAFMAGGIATAQDQSGEKMPMHKGGGSDMMHMMQDADANKDGVLTREEVSAAKKARFATLDANGDGAISMDEMKVQHDEMMAKREAKMSEKMPKKMKERMSEKMAGMKGKKQSMMSEHFAKMDKNGDGTLTFDEFGHAGEKDMFARMDSNGDGRITEDERKAGGMEMHKHKDKKKMKKHD